MTGHDPGETCMKPRVGGEMQDLVEKNPAQPSVLVFSVDVNGVLDARGIRRLGLPGRNRRKTQYPLDIGIQRVVVDGHNCTEHTGVMTNPFLLHFQRARDQVHRDGGLRHFQVVDGTERLGIGQGHSAGSNRHGTDDKGRQPDSRLLKLPPPFLETENALLAQSVEHFHGKEKVVGSIPTEGSTDPTEGSTEHFELTIFEAAASIGQGRQRQAQVDLRTHPADIAAAPELRTRDPFVLV